ncbi:MAG: hypothetical protein RL329_3597 [Bacteroidota bacterium]|jgi:hypothetical protein
MKKPFDCIIVIAHIGIEGKYLSKKECFACLAADAPAKKIFINFDVTQYKLSELYDAPFEAIAQEQKQKFQTAIAPVLSQNPNALIAYFGFTSIPAAFHAGFLFNGFHDFIIYQFHHEQKIWYREFNWDEAATFKMAPVKLPNKIEKSKGNIAIRISTSYRIEPQHSYEILPSPTNEFDIILKKLSPDSFSNQLQIRKIVDKFQEVLSACSNCLPNRDKIHLFASVSAGIPFALGTKLNPTIFPPIQTYQYSKDRTPKYCPAILIKSTSNSSKKTGIRLLQEEYLEDNILANNLISII